MEIYERANGWSLKFQRGSLRLIKVDLRLGLLIADGTEKVDLSIETSFTMAGSQDSFICTPADPRSLSPVLPLINSTIETISVMTSGELTVRFESGILITIKPDATYEAWQLGASSGVLFVCPPDGGAVIFKK